MPKLPQYESRRDLTTQQPAQVRTGAAQDVASVGGPIIKAGQEMAQKWQTAVDTMQYNTAKANISTGLAQIKAEAKNDPDYNNSQKYYEDIKNIISENATGFDNKQLQQAARIEFNNDAQIAGIEIGSIFRTKMVDNAKADLLRNMEASKANALEATTQATYLNSISDIEKLINMNVKSGIITDAHGAKMEITAKENIRKGIVNRDIDLDPEIALDQLKKGKDGMYPNLTKPERSDFIEKAKKRIKVNEARIKKESKEQQDETESTMIDKYLNNELTVAEVEQAHEVKLADEKTRGVGDGFALAMINNLTSDKAVDAETKDKSYFEIMQMIVNEDEYSGTEGAQKIMKKILDESTAGNLSESDRDNLLYTQQQGRKLSVFKGASGETSNNFGGIIGAVIKTIMDKFGKTEEAKNAVDEMLTEYVNSQQPMTQNELQEVGKAKIFKMTNEMLVKEGFPTGLEVGDYVQNETTGKNYKIIGFFDDGEPNVVEE